MNKEDEEDFEVTAEDWIEHRLQEAISLLDDKDLQYLVMK